MSYYPPAPLSESVCRLAKDCEELIKRLSAVARRYPETHESKEHALYAAARRGGLEATGAGGMAKAAHGLKPDAAAAWESFYKRFAGAELTAEQAQALRAMAAWLKTELTEAKGEALITLAATVRQEAARLLPTAAGTLAADLRMQGILCRYDSLFESLFPLLPCRGFDAASTLTALHRFLLRKLARCEQSAAPPRLRHFIRRHPGCDADEMAGAFPQLSRRQLAHLLALLRNRGQVTVRGLSRTRLTYYPCERGEEL